MKKTIETHDDTEKLEPTFNGNFTAKPKPRPVRAEPLLDNEGPSEEMVYGEANLEDAIESGYTDEDGYAVSMATPDKEGSPTGAYTDIGAGRSSVVKHH
jgi:hypothetical protein